MIFFQFLEQRMTKKCLCFPLSNILEIKHVIKTLATEITASFLSDKLNKLKKKLAIFALRVLCSLKNPQICLLKPLSYNALRIIFL